MRLGALVLFRQTFNRILGEQTKPGRFNFILYRFEETDPNLEMRASGEVGVDPPHYVGVAWVPISGLQHYASCRREISGRKNTNYNQRYLHAGRVFKPAKRMRLSSSWRTLVAVASWMDGSPGNLMTSWRLQVSFLYCWWWMALQIKEYVRNF